MQHIDLENKKILITGAAGFIGSYLARKYWVQFRLSQLSVLIT